MKKTKIVCTIGPKTESKKMLTLLLEKGMNVMRLNFSHGDHNEHEKRINNLRSVLKKTGYQAAIILDTKGPEIRTMLLEKEEVFLESEKNFILSTDKSVIGNENIVAVNYENLTDDIKVGNIILIDDGIISLKVIKIYSSNILCKILNSGYLGNNKGINIPGISINMPSLDEKDKLDLIFGCKQKVDFIAASFVRNTKDIKKIRKYLDDHDGKNIQIISKIENQEGLNNFNSIMKISDGIMIARGDLGVEIPVEEVILAQKKMIKECNKACKIVITATQMLDSMINNPRPTRAEAGDVANAIIDGTDAVMLSGESAKGKYPVDAVNIMSKICEVTDKIIRNKISYKKENNIISISETLQQSAVIISEKIHASLIVVKTKNGKSAKKIRKYFPCAQILALTNYIGTVNKLILSRGIIPYYIKNINSYNFHELYKIITEILLTNNLAKSGELIVIINTENNIVDNAIYIKKI